MHIAPVALLLASCACGEGPTPPDCLDEEAACGRACVLLGEDPANCGACGVTCPADEVCFGGACRGDCPPGTDRCERTCRALSSDPAHCGACEVACGATEICDRGTCTCPEGLAACAGECVDAQTNPAHCGACDASCSGQERCVGGACGCAGERRETACDDGDDDDCDGLADCEDSDCADSVVVCEGACGAGVRRCEDGARAGCAGGDGGGEVCGNGIDDDCDGESLDAPDSLEPTDLCAECYPLPSDPVFEVSATIDSVFDASDCYSFEAVDDAEYAERIVVRLQSLAPDLDLDLHLYRGPEACETRTPTASSTAGPGEDEEVTVVETLGADESDEWYVRVVRVAGFSCDDPYQLTVDGLR